MCDYGDLRLLRLERRDGALVLHRQADVVEAVLHAAATELVHVEGGAEPLAVRHGAGLQVESFWASHQPNELQIELFGDEAGAQFRPLKIFKTQDGVPHDIAVDIPLPTQAWDRIAGHFIDCILDGKTCEAPLRHGYQVQQMMEALLESGETGQEIRIA